MTTPRNRQKPAGANIHIDGDVDPAKIAAGIRGPQKTLYEVSVPIVDTDVDGKDFVAWRPVEQLLAADADSALKVWANAAGEAYTGGGLRAVPVRNITQREGTVKLERQLTFS